MRRQISGSAFLKNPWLAFAPFLLFYMAIVVLLHESYAFRGDGERYLAYARNLLAGRYALDEDVHLWNGPGYPLLLAPFTALGLPLLAVTLFNAVMQYVSVVFLYKTIVLYASRGAALFFALFWALHFTAYEQMPMIMTEPLTVLLVSLLAYFTALSFRAEPGSRPGRYLVLAGLVLGYLALTKVIFGQVLLLGLALAAALFLLSRGSKNARRLALILLIALAANAPYLAYTYQVTGRLFYWADSGGMSLYWMSTPYENEYGDWQSDQFSAGFKGRNTEAIRKNHEADYAEIYRLKGAERDGLFKEKALENIRNNPRKYLANWVANVSRLFFGFPNSYQYENLKFLKMFPNIFLLVLMCYSVLITAFNFRKFPFEIIFLTALAFVYLGLSSIVSAYPRMLLAIAPLLLLWIAICVSRTIRISLGFGPPNA